MPSPIQAPDLIPTPRSLELEDGRVDLVTGIRLVVAGGDEEDRFAAEYLRDCLRADHDIEVGFGDGDGFTITLGRGDGPAEGYELRIGADGAQITGSDAAGVYWATQTLRQCVLGHGTGAQLPLLRIEDAPALAHRAMHYDTKHHQDTEDYVRAFIRELAHFKANVLVWEWEDKLAYRSHPEIGAPGAFTVEQMQDLTRYARRHHVEIVPLVQGLGHVSFILKHERFRHLREIPDSDWEFCPLKDGSYDLLFELWAEAMEATPGSRFFHIGSDETYELGQGEACGCAAKAAEVGNNGLMKIFIDRCVDWVESQGRTCLSWGGQWTPGTQHPPRRSMIWADGDDPAVVAASVQAGYPCWIYAPNTGIVPLVVFTQPWRKCSMWHDHPGRECAGGFADNRHAIATAAREQTVSGSITTSWDDSGLHNQMWMPHFVSGCENSWNPNGPALDEWIDRFYRVYFGPEVYAMRECQHLLQEGAQFYDDTLERRVWHYGDIGKLHLPDFPRDGLEFDPFWRRRYASLIQRAGQQRLALTRATAIIDRNLAANVSRRYDLEVMRSCAELMSHNVESILMLGELERNLERASRIHFENRVGALAHLREMESMLGAHLEERERVYRQLVSCWERTRLPKGLSLPGHRYCWKRERARHFANRTPDLRYLVLDWDLLEIETYRERLQGYIAHYVEHEVGDVSVAERPPRVEEAVR